MGAALTFFVKEQAQRITLEDPGKMNIFISMKGYETEAAPSTPAFKVCPNPKTKLFPRNNCFLGKGQLKG